VEIAEATLCRVLCGGVDEAEARAEVAHNWALSYLA
jgi:hypothetical protein